jgi:lysophospholipase L1-like esterase
MTKLILSLCSCLLLFLQSPECVNRSSLKNFDAKIAKIKANQDAVVNIVWLGDSLTVQDYTTQALRSDLWRELGDASVGFVRFDGSGWPYYSIVHSTGTWIERYQEASALGLHINDSTSSEIGASKTASINGIYNVDSITIHYIRQPGGGKFRYKVDEGKWKKIKTKGQDTTLETKRIDGLSVANHTLTVEVKSGKVTLIGADFQLGNRGAKVHMIGNTGSRAWQWTKVNPAVWQQGLAALNPTVVVLQFSTNEQSLLEFPPSLVASYRTLISWIRLAAPDADIILTTDPDTAQSGKPAYASTSEYSAAIRELAAELNLGFVDFCAHLGPYEQANAAAHYSDSVHVTESGGKILADFVKGYLNNECARSD